MSRHLRISPERVHALFGPLCNDWWRTPADEKLERAKKIFPGHEKTVEYWWRNGVDDALEGQWLEAVIGFCLSWFRGVNRTDNVEDIALFMNTPRLWAGSHFLGLRSPLEMLRDGSAQLLFAVLTLERRA